MTENKLDKDNCELRDLFRSWSSFWKAWGPGIVVQVIAIFLLNTYINGKSLPILYGGSIGAVSILLLGASCVRNALRCVRFHCVVLGIAYPILAGLLVGIAIGYVPVSINVFWFLIYFPITVIAFIPEFIGMKYIQVSPHAGGS